MVIYHAYFYFPPGAIISENCGHSGLVGVLKFVIHANKQQILGVFDPQNYQISQSLLKQGPIFAEGSLCSKHLPVILSNRNRGTRGEQLWGFHK